MGSNTKEYSLAYYHAHKEGNITCECGKTVIKSGIYKHRHTKVHKKNMEILNTLAIETPNQLNTLIKV